MTAILSDLRAAGQGVASRIVYGLQLARRTTPGPALVRVVATLSALVAMGAAVPTDLLRSTAAVFLAPVAVGVGLFPRTRWVSLFLLGTVAAWLITTIGYDEAASPLRLLPLAAGLYLAHSAAALAAVLPYDAVVSAVTLLRWLGRAAVVVVASLTFGLGGLTVLARLQAVQTLAAPIIGSVVAAALAGLLAWQLRRR